MSATRTQVYLTEEQRQAIDAIATEEGVTMAVVIRRALDAYLEQPPEPEAILAATFGSVPEFSVPSRHDWRRG